MSDDPLPVLSEYSLSLGNFGRNKKRNILIIIILALAASLFFSILFRHNAFAKDNISIVLTPDFEVMDPMERIGQGFQEELARQNENRQLCEVASEKDSVATKPSLEESAYLNMVKGHPMEAMISRIAQKDKTVAAFLIGIAKKESDWGTYSPKKDGRDCYNYWGYRGGYNSTDSGYSCFDSPEQAVDVVGDRLSDLIAKKIDTPARMVVWKCGSTCAGHDPVAVKKWISDVDAYYQLAQS